MNRCFARAYGVSGAREGQPARTMHRRALVIALLLGGLLPASVGWTRETFSVEYTVEVRADDPTTAYVRWDLAGVDEVRRIRLKADARRFTAFRASGRLEEHDGEIAWWPDAPYGHLTYQVQLRHRRAPTAGFDSWAGADWIVTHTRQLFPRSAILFATNVEPNAEARARLVFRMPAAWQVVSALAPDGARGFVVESPRARFDRPRGWLMLGRFARIDASITGTRVIVATAGVGTTSAEEILPLVRQGLPELQSVLAHRPARLLIARAPDPMWRGGLSASNSFYMHVDRPIRTPDRTSPYLHELFHVMSAVRPGLDAGWVTEGLAEFYSVEVQRRIGALDRDDFRRALQSFARHGRWQRDFTRTTDFALRNNSAPLLMWALDRRIREATDDARGLDDVVRALAAQGGVVTTASFLGAVRRIADTNFDAFFRRHVYRGEPPSLASLE